MSTRRVDRNKSSTAEQETSIVAPRTIAIPYHLPGVVDAHELSIRSPLAINRLIYATVFDESMIGTVVVGSNYITCIVDTECDGCFGSWICDGFKNAIIFDKSTEIVVADHSSRVIHSIDACIRGIGSQECG